MAAIFPPYSYVTIVLRKQKRLLRQERKAFTDMSARSTVRLIQSRPKKMQTTATGQKVRVIPPTESKVAYRPPRDIIHTTLGALIQGIRTIPEDQQERMGLKGGGLGAKIWAAGDLTLVKRPCVAVVGARDASAEGAARARRLARELARAGVVVVSGLARGVDTAALGAAIDAGGRVIAVIGTPITRAYPRANNRLQEKIYREHLLISQFSPARKVFPSNFPERNKLMAGISDATVIIQAKDESGTLHQAWECVRLKRWLFIAKSLVEDPSVHWTKDFLDYPTTKVLANTAEILQLVSTV